MGVGMKYTWYKYHSERIGHTLYFIDRKAEKEVRKMLQSSVVMASLLESEPSRGTGILGVNTLSVVYCIFPHE